MRKVLLVVLLGVCVFVCGCCHYQRLSVCYDQRYVTIITEPEGAVVTQVRPMDLEDIKLGKTPLKKKLVMVVSELEEENLPCDEKNDLVKNLDHAVVRIEKEGYETCERVLEVKKGETVIHNVTLTEVKK